MSDFVQKNYTLYMIIAHLNFKKEKICKKIYFRHTKNNVFSFIQNTYGEKYYKYIMYMKFYYILII